MLIKGIVQQFFLLLSIKLCRHSRSLGQKFKTQIFKFRGLIDPSNQNQNPNFQVSDQNKLYHTP